MKRDNEEQKNEGFASDINDAVQKSGDIIKNASDLVKHFDRNRSNPVNKAGSNTDKSAQGGFSFNEPSSTASSKSSKNGELLGNGLKSGTELGKSAAADAGSAATTAGTTATTTAGSTAATTAAGTAVAPGVGTFVGAVLGISIGQLNKHKKSLFSLLMGILLMVSVTSGAMVECIPNILVKGIYDIYNKVVTAVEEILSKIPFFGDKLVAIFEKYTTYFENDFMKDISEDYTNSTSYSLKESTEKHCNEIDILFEDVYEIKKEETKSRAASNNWDVEMTMASFENQGYPFTNTDYAYIISMASATEDFDDITFKKFQKLLENIKKTNTKTDTLLTINMKEAIFKKYLPVTVPAYAPASVEIANPAYKKGGKEPKTLTISAYVESGTQTLNIVSEDGMEVPAFSAAGSDVSGNTYYQGGGTTTVYPKIKEIKYGQVSFDLFTLDDLYSVFDLLKEEKYIPDNTSDTGMNYDTTVGDMVDMRAKITQKLIGQYIGLSGSSSSSSGSYYGSGSTLSKDEIRAYLNLLPSDTSGNRKQIIKTALSVVGAVPYNFGGKPHNAGWNDCWWSYTQCVDSQGRPGGLDCSGFIQWTFWTAGFGNLSHIGSTGSISSSCTYVEESDLKPGDLGLLYTGGSSGASINHVGIYLGKVDGKTLWIHCSSSKNTVAVTTCKFKTYRVVSNVNIEGNDLWDGDDDTHIVTYSGAEGNPIEATTDELYLAAQVVSGESRGEGNTGMQAVAEVILNRVGDSDFPNTITDIVSNSQQFNAFTSQMNRPTEAALANTKAVLQDGVRVFNDGTVLFFKNPGKGNDGNWQDGSRVRVVWGRINNHVFYHK